MESKTLKWDINWYKISPDTYRLHTREQLEARLMENNKTAASLHHKKMLRAAQSTMAEYNMNSTETPTSKITNEFEESKE